jgi:hypothetical protein
MFMAPISRRRVLALSALKTAVITAVALAPVIAPHFI